MTLRPQQLEFCEHVARGLPGAEAARLAGYAPKTSRKRAWELMRRPAIRSEIRHLRQARLEKADVDAFWVLREAALRASVTPGDLLDDEGRPIPLKDLSDHVGHMVRKFSVEIREAEDEVVRIVSVELESRTRVLEIVGKHADVAALRAVRADQIDDDPLVIVHNYAGNAPVREGDRIRDILGADIIKLLDAKQCADLGLHEEAAAKGRRKGIQ